MKFTPGNLIIHNPTKSRWIVLSNKKLKEVPRINPNSPYLVEIECVCVLVGLKPRYWDINQRDTFILTNQDLEESDYVWSVINEI